jgi:predicted RNase H-like HicB family nuclease
MKSQQEYYILDGYEVRSFYSSEDEAFVAMIESLPGCYVDASTREEALALLRHEKNEWIRAMNERGHAIPAPKFHPERVFA